MKPYGRALLGQWDRVAGWGCVAVGAVLVLVGAVSVADAQNVLDQLSYLASSIAVGLFLLGVGAVLILTADSRDEWRKLDEISAALRAVEIDTAQAETATASGSTAPREITLPDTSAGGATAAGRNGGQSVALHSVAFPALALAGLGTLGGAGGVRESVSEASALRWMQLVAISLLVAVFTVARTHLRARQGLARRFHTLSLALAPAAAPAGGAATNTDTTAGTAVWVVAGSSLCHQAGCDLLRYSAAEPVPAAEAARRGLAPCQVCR